MIFFLTEQSENNHKQGLRDSENEIDAIAENELDDTAVFYEIKRNKANISLPKLEEKASCFLRATGQFNGYKLSCLGLSMEEM